MRQCYRCGYRYSGDKPRCLSCGARLTALDRLGLWRGLRRYRAERGAAPFAPIGRLIPIMVVLAVAYTMVVPQVGAPGNPTTGAQSRPPLGVSQGAAVAALSLLVAHGPNHLRRAPPSLAPDGARAVIAPGARAGCPTPLAVAPPRAMRHRCR